MQKEIKDSTTFTKILILFLVIVGLLIFTSCSKTVAENYDLTNSIEVINKYIPGYKLITIDEYDSYTKEYFKNNYPNKNPAIVYGDFDGNGFPDFAVLLRDVSKKNSLAFAILLQVSNSKYVLNYKLDIDRIYCDLYIVEVKPGETLYQTGSSHSIQNGIVLKNPAISLVCVGKNTDVYYWDNKGKQFNFIPTAD